MLLEPKNHNQQIERVHRDSSSILLETLFWDTLYVFVILSWLNKLQMRSVSIWLVMPLLQVGSSTSINLRLRVTASHGLLLWAGNVPKDNKDNFSKEGEGNVSKDYIMIGISNGLVEVRQLNIHSYRSSPDEGCLPNVAPELIFAVTILRVGQQTKIDFRYNEQHSGWIKLEVLYTQCLVILGICNFISNGWTELDLIPIHSWCWFI